MKLLSRSNGQALLLTVVAIGGVLLGAMTIAGLLLIYQIRQSTDLKNSNKAIFAADAGIEWATYSVVHGTSSKPVFSEGTLMGVGCYDLSGQDGPCSPGRQIYLIRSFGRAGKSTSTAANRWLEVGSSTVAF